MNKLLSLAVGMGLAVQAFVVHANASNIPDTQTRVIQTPKGAQVEVFINGTGAPIVLLPSRGRGAEDFDPVVPFLQQKGYQVIRPEPRGIGKSTGPTENITLHDLAEDINQVIEQVAKKPAVIAGHAFGNWVARMTAVDHPDAVRGVVIIAAAAKSYPEAMPELVEKVRHATDQSVPEAQRLAALEYGFFSKGHDARSWLKGSYGNVSKLQRAAGKATPQSEWWSGGNAPLLEIQGDLDPFKPQSTRQEMKDEFGSRISTVVIANASHALVPEQPQALADALDSWIKTLKP
ncbi:alpha/beta fold hydrolase [Advenella mimigardefordensis]|uniref:Alpha/beta hydrolase fold domain-containing protein n=1 Tax=Advenella mimigardefordensis (strain DSM 17166 / LMG 22922 / DPN7) TaxID=1247726 RepID=W0PKI1_ADVMD|nr:alpha/beta hydrolase [Advenella mimigardefordensis]AHG65508.1 alpha/beta hydrolase fold domain-containing protein [Advenella mimigardefordensis DPN7]